MKLAALGIIVAVIGLVVGEDGLLLTAALWVPGGLIVRLIHGPVDRKPPSATFKGAFGRRRGLATVVLIAIGLASFAIGALPVMFDGDAGWRWIPVAVGGLAAGTQLLAILGLGLGSGLQALTGTHGNPEHPATIRLDQAKETGVRINDRPKMELTLTVTPEGRAAYTIVVRQLVGFAELGALRVGATYRGLVDLDVPEGVRIHWHAPLGAVPATSATTDNLTDRLRRVDELLRDGVITAEEHVEARRDILGEL